MRTLAVFTYREIAFLGLTDINHPQSWLARTEWALECLIAVIYSCRRCWLVWLPPKVLGDIAEIGVRRLLEGSPEDTIADAEVVLREMRAIRWSKVQETQRTLSEFVDPFTPVFANGDRVPFDPEKWETNLPEEQYLLTDRQGRPLAPYDDRGSRITGDARHLRTESHPEGYPQGRNARGERVRENRRYGLSHRAYDMADRALNRALHDAGITEQLRSLGMAGRPGLKDVVQFLDRGVKDRRFLPISGVEFCRRFRDAYEADEKAERPNKRRRTESGAGSDEPLDKTIAILNLDDPTDTGAYVMRTERYVHKPKGPANK